MKVIIATASEEQTAELKQYISSQLSSSSRFGRVECYEGKIQNLVDTMSNLINTLVEQDLINLEKIAELIGSTDSIEKEECEPCCR